MNFDAIRNIPFYTWDNYILPVEALLSSVEVKSKLNQEEIREILKNAQNLKLLRPFGKPLDIFERGRKIEDQVNCRYYHCVFAYSTDLVEKDWLKNEFDRIKRVAAEEKMDYSLIDRLIVLDRGLYNLSNFTGTESKDNAQLFM
jgi:hypothetical protein